MDLLKYSLSVSQSAYEQENRRTELINQKKDYIFKWLTIIFGLINVLFPILVKNNEISNKKCFVMYAILMCFLLLDILIVIIMGIPQKVKIYPLGSEILQSIQKNPENFKSERDCTKQQIFYTDVMTQKLSRNNNKQVVWLIGANVIMVVVMVLM